MIRRIANKKATYQFNRRWRPTQTFSLGHVLYGLCPPNFLTIPTSYRFDKAIG